MMGDIGYQINDAYWDRLGYTPATARPPSDGLFPNKTLAISDFVRYKEGALQGSGQAALALADHYSDTGDIESAEYWYRIGTQNGNSNCQYRYGNILAGKRDMLDQERGKFWLGQINEN